MDQVTLNSKEAVETLLAQADVEAAAQLRVIAESTEDKNTRKAARRALYLLSQRGIAPPPPAPQSTISTPSASSRPLLSAWASAYDGAGNRLVFLTWTNADGGHPSFLQALLNDEAGVRDMDTRRISRRELDERLEGYAAQLEGGIALAEIAPDYGRFLLHQARELSRQARHQTPTGFVDLLNALGEPEQAYPTAPVWQRVTEAEVRAEADAPPAADLFQLPWFQAWFLDVNDVVPWLSDIYEVILDSDASEDAKKQGLEDVARKAAAELFDDDRSDRYARRLEETADVLHRRGREPEAKQALRHALDLREAASGGDSEFAVALVQRTMQAAIEMLRQRG